MILRLNNLTKSYPSTENSSDIHVLSGLGLEIHEGETVAILGQSGSGKSTLLTLIAGLDTPTAGEVLLEEKDLNRMSEQELARFRSKKIGIIFQRFHLMPHLTALENISLPLELNREANARELALETLDAVGLIHRKNHFPHQLSGGECQRVAIARSVVIRPALLLADEPTGNLDEKTGEKVSNILFRLVESTGMTLLLVTHNQILANQCNRKLFLRNGGLHETLV